MARGGRRMGGRRSQPSTPRTSRTSNPATPSSGRGSDGLFANGQWFCDCKPRRPAALRETRKPGANKGRWFYTCPQERRSQCTFFLWEDYAGVSGGDRGGHAGPSSAQAPRPTYRTSMGQRTTPPAERMDGPAQMTLAGQRSLPPPPPSSTSRQRIFTTPTAAREFPDNMAYGGYENQGGEEEEDEDDGFEPPPTPTPARTRRQNENAAAAAPPAAVEPPPVAEVPNHPITKYFGVVKKNGSAGDKGDGRSTTSNVPAAQTAQNGHKEIDYSDSEFDSDMERALVALADHSERKTLRSSDKEKETGVDIKKEEEVDDGTNMSIDDEAMERRRRIIVPLHGEEQQRQQEQQEPETPSRRRAGRRLLVASDEYTAKEAPAEAAEKILTQPAADFGAVSSFATLFGRGDNVALEPQPNTSFVSSVPSSQPASQVASSQALTQQSAMTTPPSSFRSDAGMRSGASTGSRKKRRPVDPWYGTSTQGHGSDDDSDDNDPFTSTPSKRVRFHDETEETTAASLFMHRSAMREMTSKPIGTGNSPTSTPKGKKKEAADLQRPHWADDEGMHVDSEGEDSQETPVLLPKKPSTQSSSQPKDHNVTLAVLQLLSGQPVEPRVRQQIRALLNGAFEDESSV
ncbi:hypothetical protein SEUCBS139899_008281 [Sporothrix eucalyptigena]